MASPVMEPSAQTKARLKIKLQKQPKADPNPEPQTTVRDGTPSPAEPSAPPKAEPSRKLKPKLRPGIRLAPKPQHIEIEGEEAEPEVETTAADNEEVCYYGRRVAGVYLLVSRDGKTLHDPTTLEKIGVVKDNELFLD